MDYELPAGEHKHFPRGFIVSNRRMEVPSTYSRLAYKGLFMYVDSRTIVTKSPHGKFKVTVFGFIYDSEAPDRTPQEIVNSLAVTLATNRMSLLNALYTLGGRYAVLCHDEQGLFVAGDAGGARTIFYNVSPDCFIVSSHARLLASQINAELSEYVENIQSFGDTHRARNWPGRQSMFNGVLQLTPNTCLNLRNGKVNRFFGMNKPPLRSVKEAAEIASKLILNSVSAFAKHYLGDESKAVLFLTCGMDSRLVVGSFKNHYACLESVTYRLSDAHDADVAIAAQLADRVGISNNSIEIVGNRSGNLHEWCEINGAGVYVGSRRIIHKIYDEYRDERYKYSVRGNLGEIARGVFINRPAFSTIPHKFMARNWYRGSDQNEAILDAFLDFSDAIELDMAQWPVRALYYWEHKHATWFGTTLNEMDIMFDTFVPMNSRNIIEAMYGVSDQDQLSDAVPKEMVNLLRPDLLDFPINPGKYDKPKQES
ncbi:hypothetical protein [Pseudomonas kurunegalensis]|uniref:hypothetical protein n=1 Tax=Pseudomonas kurunegalensis TaxID=485880 RepID=UPI00211812DD|nr:hypothetical protein [Pseudomonas kurunegalensis]